MGAPINLVLLHGATETASAATLARVARAGKSIAVNESVETIVVNITQDIKSLNELKEDLDQEIIGNFGTLRFFLGKPIENRATAYAELRPTSRDERVEEQIDCKGFQMY